MKTASFFTYTGPGRVSIARFAPRGTPKGFRGCRDLAPGTWFNSVRETEYIALFRTEVLARLDPKETWDRLHEMAAGTEPVLLCWEKPTDPVKDPTAYCHRSLIALWFAETLGHLVDELGFESQPHPLLPRSLQPNRPLLLSE